jgi:UDP-N-acetylglucosamine--N-acetylmuramyl-(pentapeptide) pyrophosphoryl-undecaprenol N-acetylglucosamine transferase
VTNKLLICVAYQGMEKFFPKQKLIETGNPVRSDILNILSKKDEGIAYFNLHKNKKTIVVLGGSLGAKTLNEAIENNAELIDNQKDIQILWQCGRLYETTYKNGKAAALPQVVMRPFLDRMDLAYAVADVIIARAGALTISELCLAGTPSVLVPSPNVAEDHQTKNAMALVEKEAALLVKDSEASLKMIPTAFDTLQNPELLTSLSQNIKQLGKPNAAKDIAEVVRKAALFPSF